MNVVFCFIPHNNNNKEQCKHICSHVAFVWPKFRFIIHHLLFRCLYLVCVEYQVKSIAVVDCWNFSFFSIWPSRWVPELWPIIEANICLICVITTITALYRAYVKETAKTIWYSEEKRFTFISLGGHPKKKKEQVIWRRKRNKTKTSHSKWLLG